MKKTLENHTRLKGVFYYQIHDIDYFRFYLLVNNGKPFRRIDAIESNRVGYHANIKFRKYPPPPLEIVGKIF